MGENLERSVVSVYRESLVQNSVVLVYGESLEKSGKTLD